MYVDYGGGGGGGHHHFCSNDESDGLSKEFTSRARYSRIVPNQLRTHKCWVVCVLFGDVEYLDEQSCKISDVG